MPKYKSIKAYSVIFTDIYFAKKDDLLSFIFRDEEQAKNFIGKQQAIIVPIIIKQL